MDDYRLDYWIEAVETVLEDMDKYTLFAPGDIKYMAEGIQGYAEQESMAFGTEFIPNPMETEISKLKAEHEKEIERFESDELLYRTNIANRYGPSVSAGNVYTRNGYIVID